MLSATTILFWVLLGLLAILGAAIELGRTRGLGPRIGATMVVGMACALVLLLDPNIGDAALKGSAPPGAKRTINPMAREKSALEDTAPLKIPAYVTDCATCPQLALVRGGQIQSWRNGDVPQTMRVVSFALARNEVTREDFASFVAATGHRAHRGCLTGTTLDATADWESPGLDQSGQHPVVCVSIEDAEAYVAWLSRKSGHTYRLPGEAEWEYAARAEHAESPRDMGAALEWNVGRSRDGTVATGTSPPNGWGVVDIIGNAAEYVADCWIAPPAEPPGDDRMTATGGDGCQTGIVRGGSWRTPWKTDLLGHRERTSPSNTVGFRVARDLTLTEAQRFEENTGISEILRHAHQRSRKRSE